MGNKELYLTIIAPAIMAKTSGAVFRIRDVFPNPPALVGKLVSEDQQRLGIRKIPNPDRDCNLWMKIEIPEGNGDM